MLKIAKDLLILGGFILLFLAAPPKPSFFNSRGEALTNVRVSSPLIAAFNKPVEKSSLAITIYPELEGRWEFNGNSIISEAVFYPSEKMLPGTPYKVVVRGMRNYFSKLRTQAAEYDFVTERVPNLIAGTGMDKTAVNFPTNGHISIVFDQPNDVSELAAVIQPNTKNHVVITGDAVNIVFDEELKQETFYRYQLLDMNSPADDKVLAEGSVTTVGPPHIKEISPLGDHVLVNSKIKIILDAAVNKKTLEENFSIKPVVNGTISWPTTNEFNFTPVVLAYNTKYVVTLKQGVRTQAGGILEKDLTVDFRTIGHAYITRMSPAKGAPSVSTGTSIYLIFDQAVNHQSAQDHFSISPNVHGTFSWGGNKMKFTPASALKKGTRYTITETKGVKSINGLVMSKTFSGYFTTVAPLTKLNVPVYYQTYALSCEESSLRAALAYRGIYKTDWQILQTVGYSPTNRNFSTNFWKNPQSLFVGHITGNQNTTGYGVHWNPIAKAARSYGRGALAFTGWSTQDLTREIGKGNPVIIWGVYGQGSKDGWNTSSGYVSNAPKGEHTRVVVGYYGSSSNPTKFILNDGVAGQIVWTTSQLKSNWAWFGNAGVVIY